MERRGENVHKPGWGGVSEGQTGGELYQGGDGRTCVLRCGPEEGKGGDVTVSVGVDKKTTTYAVGGQSTGALKLF